MGKFASTQGTEVAHTTRGKAAVPQHIVVDVLCANAWMEVVEGAADVVERERMLGGELTVHKEHTTWYTQNIDAHVTNSVITGPSRPCCCAWTKLSR